MPDFQQLVSVLGAPAAVILFIWLNDRKKEAPKDDPAVKLAAELAALRATITDLRNDMAEMSGFIKGRMK